MSLLALISLPGAVYARNQTEKLARIKVVEEPKNSQTMALLEAYLNINPSGTGGADLAIIDNSALAHQGEETSSFVDAAKSGGQISVYSVRKGDTLSSIAEMFDVSVNTIIWANEIKGGKVVEGQELVILPITGVRHVVKSGDTLKSVAAKYKADMEDLLAYNDLSLDTKIVVGDVIVVPGGEISAAPSSVKPKSTQKISITSSVIDGYFIRPIAGGKKSQGIHGNNGVDLAAPVGTPIVAAATGKVIVSRSGGYNGGYGTYVVVSHSNGTQTLYAHMSTNNVSVGETVTQGQTIGAIGMTGRTTGPHIHFEIRGTKNPF